MKKTFIQTITKMLEEQRQEITTKINNSNHIDIDIDGDETDEIQAKILALATAKLAIRDREKLVKINNALKKISDGTFGSCEECGEEIAEKRLLFNPGFITCIGCAEHLELISKRGGVI